MKKIFLTLLAVGITTLSVMSQRHSFGIQGGLNLSKLSSKNMFNDTDFKSGFAGGLKYEFAISEKHAVGADLLYAQQGTLIKIPYRNNEGSIGETFKIKYKFDYLSLPIKYGYTYVINEKFKISPKFGLQPSFLLAAKITEPQFDLSDNLIGEKATDVKENLSKFDLAGLIEIELGYVLNQNMDLFASLVGKHSLMQNDLNEEKFRHKSIAISAGLKYKFGN